MALSFRHGTAKDLSRAHELVVQGSRGMYDDATLKLLPEVWRAWLREKRLELHVFIDDQLPAARRIQGLVTGVIANDAFVGGLLEERYPYVARRVVNHEAHGQSVVLTPDEVAHANANQGINAVGLDFAFEGDWGGVSFLKWVPSMFDSLRSWVEGWNLRSGTREWFGRDIAYLARLNGWPIVRDHSRGLKEKPDPKRRMYLAAATRTQQGKAPGRFPASLFFAQREPRFRFTPAEQELLRLAVRNVSDAAAAEELALSPHTLKARWKAIFQQVGDQKPHWFPERDGDEGSSRGVEKRRHLIAWLQQHPEELRPRARR